MFAQPKSVVLNLYGAYGRKWGDWIAIAALVELMGDLGFDERAVRSAISRMKQRGILKVERRGRRSGYRLTDEAKAILAEGDKRLFASRQAASLEDGWVVVIFSVPETERRKRHLLRSRLVWQGFGNVSAGVWIAPWRQVEDTRALIVQLGLKEYVEIFRGHHEAFGPLSEKASAWWNLAELSTAYERFVGERSLLLEKWRSHQGSPREAFVDYMETVAAWQRFPYLDPGLPRELLPPTWEGQRASEIFLELCKILEGPAERHATIALTRYAP